MTEPRSSRSSAVVPAVPAQAGPAPACHACGAPAPSTPPPLTWSPAVERGARVWTCERCMREHLRSIEGRLDSPWW